MFVFALVAACSGNGKGPVGPGSGSGSAPPPVDNRSEIEKRRDAACEALQPKLFTCAIEEAKAEMSPEAFAKLKPEELRGAHRKEFFGKCKGASYSSRQIRVLEVCFREEKECGPLRDCLLNLEPKKPEAAKPDPEPK
jgi:hypothetical protein